jgi:hypothetical protein
MSRQQISYLSQQFYLRIQRFNNLCHFHSVTPPWESLHIATPAQLAFLRRGLNGAYRPQNATRHIQEHNGKLHEVTDDFDHEGETCRSLTGIARVITGTKWSGPAFFGLKRKKLPG